MQDNLTISALFVRKDSVYKTLGVDCWDIDRDATQSSRTRLAGPGESYPDSLNREKEKSNWRFGP